LNKILPLVLVLSISLLIGNQVPDAFGAKPTSITFLYNGPDATIHVEETKSMNPPHTHPTTPCGDGTPTAPCTTPVDVSNGDQFTAFPVSGMPDFETETHFYLGTDSSGLEFFWDNKNDGKAALHTSCSAPLVGEVSDVLPGGQKLTVLSQTGGSKEGTNNCPDTPPPPPPNNMIGGELLPIDTTAVLLGGSQMTASWMIPVIVAGIGIGIVIARKL